MTTWTTNFLHSSPSLRRPGCRSMVRTTVCCRFYRRASHRWRPASFVATRYPAQSLQWPHSVWFSPHAAPSTSPTRAQTSAPHPPLRHSLMHVAHKGSLGATHSGFRTPRMYLRCSAVMAAVATSIRTLVAAVTKEGAHVALRNFPSCARMGRIPLARTTTAV